MSDQWRVGWIGTSTYILDGDRAVCMCAEEDAACIVEAVNRMAEFKGIHDECHAQRDAARAEVDGLEFELMTERRGAQGPGLCAR